jgi:hypothetical protein
MDQGLGRNDTVVDGAHSSTITNAKQGRIYELTGLQTSSPQCTWKSYTPWISRELGEYMPLPIEYSTFQKSYHLLPVYRGTHNETGIGLVDNYRYIDKLNGHQTDFFVHFNKTSNYEVQIRNEFRYQNELASVQEWQEFNAVSSVDPAVFKLPASANCTEAK